MTPSNPPKGSLEDLFRHHLLESEAAAVPPRPQVWEHLDNRLLLAQNEKYRHRLATYRWAVAASLLLASLAGGGWWHSQQPSVPATATLARATLPVADRPGLTTAQRAVAIAPLAHTSVPGTRDGQTTVAAVSPALSKASAIDQTTTLSASRPTRTTAAVAYALRTNHWQQTQGTSSQGVSNKLVTTSTPAFASGNQLAARQAADAHISGQAQANYTAKSSFGSNLSSTSTALPSQSVDALATDQDLHNDQATATTATPAYAPTTATPASEASLATRWASLATSSVSLPASLAPVAVAAGPPLELARNWQYGVSYATSAFQPNIDFSKAADSYNTAFGLNSPIITRSAAAEYRNNLQAGLGQRLSLWATRRLGASRWGLRTGLELMQSTATSASTVAFVGEQVADLSYSQAAFTPMPTPARLQRTSYRYRSINVPVEARYSNPAKNGFSFYGRMGAFVTALLNVHTEVEDNPEAARTYTPASVSSPYRLLSVGLRGGGGVQFRPAGHQWALNLGPVAELGVLSLNANPSQDFLTQQRPYSFGLEAGVELGRGFKIQ
jgi:hypothetical protein